MKAIAFYLPQFHEVAENNEWWGEGFTEWTSVKKSKPLFRGQNQPEVPYKEYYYNLLDKKTMVWQSDIANRAGLEGFCFYHYWFKGKKILEKPAENLLAWKDINQKFCFSWANESWIRTWSAHEGNNWNEVMDKNKDRAKGSSILLKQDYGSKPDWKEHFDYLLPFFMDERYITIDEKPIFLIYRPDKIPCLNAMLQYWNELACANGLKGIYIIATNVQELKSRYINARVLYEPGFTLQNELAVENNYKMKLREILRRFSIDFLNKYSYDRVWKIIIRRKFQCNIKTYLGAYVNYDDTPRRGQNALIFAGANPKKFCYYLKQLVSKSESELESDIIFITAWNEWAEGAHLEPDQINKYGYLRAIKKIIGH